MDASDDHKKWRNNLMNDWTNNPFERVNHSTNFEDYACGSDDNNFLQLNTSYDKKGAFKTSDTNSADSRDMKSVNKCSKLEPSVWSLLSEHKDHNSSTEVTPSGTPQSSPYSIRKAFENKSMSKNGKESTNSKRWFYSGFFTTDYKTGLDDKPISQMAKNPSFKNLCVSNFDINAVGPTSW